MTKRRIIGGLFSLLAIAIISFGVTMTVARSGRPVSSSSAPTDSRATSSTSDLATVEPLLDWLKVPAAHKKQLLDHDRTFSTDLQQLRHDLSARRADLAAALEKPESSDELIRDKVEEAIAARNAIERRTAQYLLNIRHHLSAEQQKQLLGLAAEEVRRGAGGGGRGAGGGWRWRHGQPTRATPSQSTTSRVSRP